MSTQAHTPGPWRIESVGDETLEIWAHPRIAVGQLYGQNGPNESDIVRANAHLIAAAPDMLAALKAAQQRLNESGTGEMGLIDTIHAVHALIVPAIAKAEGNNH
jgi:hypothetical protein